MLPLVLLLALSVVEGLAFAAPAEDARPVLVAFGDSLTFGQGVKRGDAYPARLQKLLDDSGFSFRVVNAGVSGDTTAGALRRVDSVLSHKPTVVVVCLGANDGLRGQPLDSVQANLKRIVSRLKKKGVTVVLAGMKLPLNYGADYGGRFEALYPKVAKAAGVAFIPFLLEGVAAQPDLNLDDGVHPNPDGYAIISRTVFQALQPLLDPRRQTN